jgi:hypothetical protein
MTNFYETESGETRYKFNVEYEHSRIALHPRGLVETVVERISEFVPYTRADRSYDGQAILGRLWDDSGVKRRRQLGRILSALASLPNSPLERNLESPPERQRYWISI